MSENCIIETIFQKLHTRPDCVGYCSAIVVRNSLIRIEVTDNVLWTIIHLLSSFSYLKQSKIGFLSGDCSCRCRQKKIKEQDEKRFQQADSFFVPACQRQVWYCSLKPLHWWKCTLILLKKLYVCTHAYRLVVTEKEQNTLSPFLFAPSSSFSTFTISFLKKRRSGSKFQLRSCRQAV